MALADVSPGDHEIAVTATTSAVRQRAGKRFDVNDPPTIDFGPGPETLARAATICMATPNGDVRRHERPRPCFGASGTKSGEASGCADQVCSDGRRTLHQPAGLARVRPCCHTAPNLDSRTDDSEAAAAVLARDFDILDDALQ
jgi:hypothetical protein